MGLAPAGCSDGVAGERRREPTPAHPGMPACPFRCLPTGQPPSAGGPWQGERPKGMGLPRIHVGALGGRRGWPGRVACRSARRQLRVGVSGNPPGPCRAGGRRRAHCPARPRACAARSPGEAVDPGQGAERGWTPPLCGTSSSDILRPCTPTTRTSKSIGCGRSSRALKTPQRRSSGPRSPDGAGCSSVVQERKRRAAELPWPRAIPKGRPCRSAHVVGHREDDHV